MELSRPTVSPAMPKARSMEAPSTVGLRSAVGRVVERSINCRAPDEPIQKAFSTRSHRPPRAVPLAPSSKGYVETVIHSFQGKTDGMYPTAPLIIDAHGTLYGTTEGGSDGGSVYRLTPTPSGYAETVIWDFSSGWAQPYAPVVIGTGGVLFGTASHGGDRSRGVEYELTPSGSSYVGTDVWDFQGAPNDGDYPISGLWIGKDGALFGTTEFGGSGPKSIFNAGCGTVYEVKP
jgi:uncharacterized repeat protein (TIGR03803 family)